MSRVVRRVLGVAAAVVIPFAAPAIAKALGASMGLQAAMATTFGRTLGSAAVGAALGGASSAVLGGNVGQGALMGAIGGGIGGLRAPAPTAPPGFGLRAPATTPGFGLRAPAATPGFGLEATFPGLRAPGATPGFGLEVTPPGAVRQAPAAPLTTGARPATFAEALRQVPQTLAARFSDPVVLADLTLRAAGMLAGSAIAGEGLTDVERGLLDAQTQELRTLQQTNVGLFTQRLQQAQDLIGESRYFDPEYFGLQRARRAQAAAARAKRAGLRGLRGAARDAEARRFDLALARDVGSAFDQGYLTGIQGRLSTLQAGMQLMPTTFPSSVHEASNLRQAHDTAAERQRLRQQDIGRLFGSLTGRRDAGSRG